MSISGFFQFIIGFIVGVLLLAGSGAAAAYFFLSSLSANPPKPIFSEEQQEPEATSPPAEDAQTEDAEEPEATETESAAESPATTPETLEAGTYKARVTWPQGLSLRSQPNLEATRIGGVAYNQEVVVLGESEDQEWKNVRVSRNGKEGWVKAGNLDKVSE